MYECCKCKVKIPVLREAVLHQSICLSKWNNMVYSNFRVPAYMQYKRRRNIKAIKREKDYLKNFLIITRL